MNTFEWVKINFSNLGFDIDENLVRKSLRYISFTRQSPTCDFIQQRISVTQSSLNKQCLCIVLSIAVLQPDFLRMHENEERVFEEALSVEVLKTGFEQRGWHTSMDYSIENHSDFESDFFKRILPWLDKFSEPQIFIAVLKGELNFGAPQEQQQGSVISRTMNFLFPKPQKEARKPGIFYSRLNQKFIADILYQQGKAIEALPHMQQWINSLTRIDSWSEPYREKIKELTASAGANSET
ncbi:hypothetical protein [Undibacterium sp. Tian12W]|uniref:hypothetical protein n=1 Tax=Undibacterium sp. Tian12W TaxID=3413054 RepID=UPI003BF2C026